MTNAQHTPEQLKQANEFIEYKDLITVITDPKKLYTKPELAALIKETLKKEVD